VVNNDRERLIFHGAVVMFVGLLCGYPAVVDQGDEVVRMWRAAHLELLLLGIWLLATAGILPSLVLARREAAGLVWALLATGYGLMVALLLGAITGVRAIQPGGSAINQIAFAGSAIGILGALLAVLLTLTGARAAVRRLAPAATPGEPDVSLR
jgi:hypothetical protein